MTNIVHIHASSRFDRSNALLTKAHNRYNRHADLVTSTENAREDREQAVRRANGKQFGMVHGDKSSQNDCLICYRRSRFRVVHWENFKTTDRFYYTARGKKFPKNYATIAVLWDKREKKRIVVTVLHMASGVEGDLFRRRSTMRTLQWYDSIRRTKRKTNKVARAYKCKARLVVADFNIDFKKRWARALMKSIFRKYRLTWKKPGRIRGGTHGRRLIDASYLYGKMRVRKSARLFQDDASSDHRPFIQVLVWRKRKRKT